MPRLTALTSHSDSMFSSICPDFRVAKLPPNVHCVLSMSSIDSSIPVNVSLDPALDGEFSRLIDRLLQCKRVLLTTHVRPDGDALGTARAVSLALSFRNIGHEILVLSKMPTKYRYLFEHSSAPVIEVLKDMPLTRADMPRFDGLLVVDTGTWSQLPFLQDLVLSPAFRGAKLIIDHHQTQENWADVKVVKTTAAAAGELAAELVARLNVPMTKDIADAIFIAIASDTGWFQFSNTTPHTLRLAASLMEVGVDTDSLYQHLYQNERPERLLIQQHAMKSLELLADNRLGVMTIAKDDFAKTGAGVPDTENLVNLPLQIGTVAASAIFVDPPEGGPVRVSLRSKGQVNMARFAEAFGGGGHIRAAGLKLNEPLAVVREKVVAALLKELGTV
jgi:bifunctional oligoribonuclease and PAP phosphatase NrnA